jgi:hypothetical protein
MARLSDSRRGAGAKASPKRASKESCTADPKPRELAMARVKPGYDPVEARTHHCCKSGG